MSQLKKFLVIFATNRTHKFYCNVFISTVFDQLKYILHINLKNSFHFYTIHSFHFTQYTVSNNLKYKFYVYKNSLRTYKSIASVIKLAHSV